MFFEQHKEINLDNLRSITFSNDHKNLLASSNNEILIYDSSSFDLVDRLKGHTNNIRALKFSPCGKYLASGSWDQTIILWDFQ